ncbi:MAG: presenilin family intramembrane aspartyl protease PSH [Thermoplasmatales archaeon]|nr:presenilin family intramembrane aspartyl protease PSH [Thermoplasmatales archaeon]
MMKKFYPVIAMACFFVIAQLGAVAITPTFKEAGVQAFENPEKVENAVFYIAVILVFTAVLLTIARYGFKKLIQGIILFAVGTTMFYVFYPLLWKIIPYGIDLGVVVDIPLSLSVLLAVSLTFALYKHPEWYVVDIVGIVIAAGAASIFGLSLGILPAMILLIALAVYDAVAVYKTKHMISLADSVVDLRLPVLLVVPKKSSYSFLKQKRLKETLEKEEEREAMFMGLGDVVIPSILVVSSFRFVGSPVVTFSTLLGGLIGFIILMGFVMKGKPQAGLPLLNSGAILGYLISYYLVFQNTGFGMAV